MRVVHRLDETDLVSCSFVTVGVFDGVHLGHQRIIGGLVEAAHAQGHSAVAVTFDPHPASVLSDRPPSLLTTVGERIGLLAQLGLDTMAILPFTEEVVTTTAAAFVEDMIRHLRLAELWVGPDFTLGHGREGDVPYLRRLGVARGFIVRVIEPVVWRGTIVRSSRVRQALRRGDIEQANGCLGRNYRLSGVVVRGRGLGRAIGVPTANISPPPNRLVPAGGVYAGWAHSERWGEHAAAVNIGTRPTFAAQSDAKGLTVEAHLLDFDGDLYDDVLKVDFAARLRDERAHPTLNALVAQLRHDIEQTRATLDNRRP
jgi:riboflavin kinase/FMN adenylyltransferase